MNTFKLLIGLFLTGTAMACALTPPNPDIRVIDGDTIHITNNNSIEKVRLNCIDAPELNQPLGVEAKDYLTQLIDNATIIGLNVTGKDKFGRSLATLTIDGKSAQQSLVDKGYAYVFHIFRKNCPNYEQLSYIEQLARKDRLGVWAEDSNTPPWVYRQNKVQ